MKKNLIIPMLLFGLFLMTHQEVSAQSTPQKQVGVSITDPVKKDFVEKVKWLPVNFQQAIVDDFHLLSDQQKKELQAFSDEMKNSKGFDSAKRYQKRQAWAKRNFRQETFAKMAPSQ